MFSWAGKLTNNMYLCFAEDNVLVPVKEEIDDLEAEFQALMQKEKEQLKWNKQD